MKVFRERIRRLKKKINVTAFQKQHVLMPCSYFSSMWLTENHKFSIFSETVSEGTASSSVVSVIYFHRTFSQKIHFLSLGQRCRGGEKKPHETL